MRAKTGDRYWFPETGTCPRFSPSERSDLREGGDHFGRRLHELDQHAFPADRELLVLLGMDEGHVEARGALADAAGREAYALLLEPGDGRVQVVDPEADVVEGRVVDGRLLLGVDGLHQVNLDL